METTIQLNSELLNTEFLDNFIDCCLVKPHITPTSGNTQMGHGLWKAGYKYALRQYITDHVDGLTSESYRRKMAMSKGS